MERRFKVTLVQRQCAYIKGIVIVKVEKGWFTGFAAPAGAGRRGVSPYTISKAKIPSISVSLRKVEINLMCH